MWLLRERLSGFRENNLQTVQEWIKSCIELIALYSHTHKNSNNLRSHLRDIAALDHSRLGLENKFLENKSGRIFLAFDKFTCQQIWGRVKQPLILFIHHIWGQTVLWGAEFIIQTSKRMQYFRILQHKFHSFKYSGRWKHAWAFGEIVKKNFKITYTASRLSLLTTTKWMNNYRVALQHNKEFIMFIFYLMVLWMCNLRKRLIRVAFWVLLQAMFMNDWKQTAERLKLQERLLTIKKRNIIRWNIYRDNSFHSQRQGFKCL